MKSSIVRYLLWTFARNALIIRGVESLMCDYQRWKLVEQCSKIKYLTLDDISYTSSYINSLYVLQCLKIRGGQSDGFFLALLYRIMREIESIIINKIPFSKIPAVSKYIAFRNKRPWYKKLEKFIIWVFMTIFGTYGLIKSPKKGSFNLPLDKPWHETDLNEFAKEFDVSDTVCDGKLRFMYKTLINNDHDISYRLESFEMFMVYVVQSSNAGPRQGLLLCLISMLLFIFMNDLTYAQKLIELLYKLYKQGKISRSLLKLILRRLANRAADYEISVVVDEAADRILTLI